MNSKLLMNFILHCQARAVNETWAKRCDKSLFVTDVEDDSLPSIAVNLTGREKLWGKTKQMFMMASNLSAEFDWVLKVFFSFIETHLRCQNFRQIMIRT